MTTVFLICATVGGTILVIQFVLALVGLGAEALDIDVPHDVGGHDFGGDFHGDTGGDFHGDAGGDLHGDTSADVHGDAAGSDDHAGHSAAAAHHGSASVFRMLSFRAIVAALAFFGLAGLAAQSAEASGPTSLVVAVLAGAAAMYAVFWMMQGLHMLKAEGTVRINRAVGRHATVYLRIPGHESGAGKIQLNLQNRTMEYSATTDGDEIPTGTKVVVVDVVTSDTVKVEPIEISERTSHV